MQSRSSIIASFILVSLLVAGGVEFFCRTLGDALSVEKKVEQSVAVTGTISLPVAKPPHTGSVKAGKAQVTENYSVIAKRSLFGEVKPVEVPVQKKDPVPEALQKTTLNLTLLGTISGKGDVQRAIILDKKGKTQDIYYRGDAVGSAIIKEVKRGEVILTVGGKDEILLMEELKSGAAGDFRSSAAGTKNTGPALFTPVPVPKKQTKVKKAKPAVENGEEKKPSGYLSRRMNFQEILNKRKKDQ